MGLENSLPGTEWEVTQGSLCVRGPSACGWLCGLDWQHTGSQGASRAGDGEWRVREWMRRGWSGHIEERKPEGGWDWYFCFGGAPLPLSAYTSSPFLPSSSLPLFLLPAAHLLP